MQNLFLISILWFEFAVFQDRIEYCTNVNSYPTKQKYKEQYS